MSKIVVARNDLPESQRALRTAIDLARSCNTKLATVSILGFRGREAYGMNNKPLIGRVRRSV
jgi:hypothetical protein